MKIWHGICNQQYGMGVSEHVGLINDGPMSQCLSRNMIFSRKKTETVVCRYLSSTYCLRFYLFGGCCRFQWVLANKTMGGSLVNNPDFGISN